MANNVEEQLERRNRRVQYIRTYQAYNTGLLQTFQALVDAFNTGVSANVDPYLDSGVRLTTLTPPTTHFGKVDVMAYLHRIMDEVAVPPFFEPETTDHSTALNQVSGQGFWVDMDKPLGVHIRYVFTFVQRNNALLVSSLWGTPGG
jgi:hypothetical protein